jgi:hypothetical protein
MAAYRPSLSHRAPGRDENAREKAETDYNTSMFALAVFAMRVLEWTFFVGLAGSAVVVIISFVEDGKELFGKSGEEAEEPHPNV